MTAYAAALAGAWWPAWAACAAFTGACLLAACAGQRGR